MSVEVERETAWRLIHDIERWPTWAASVSNTELLETPKDGARGRVHLDSGAEVAFLIVKLEPARLLSLKTRWLGADLAVQIRTLEMPGGSTPGSAVSIEVLATGYYARALAWLFSGSIRNAVSRFLDQLKAAAEASAPVAASLSY